MTATEVRFVVPGRPRPKERPRVIRRGGRTITYTPGTTREYEAAVAWAARAAGVRPATGPVAVEVVFYVSGRSPDPDNLAKAVLDGLNGIAYADDRQVVRLVAEVRRAESRDRQRAEVAVRPMGA